MTTQPTSLKSSITPPGKHSVLQWRSYLPFMDWLVHYDRANLMGDLIAGLVVAIVLVPQGMAYALLAGLPPEAGLYASILPLLIYGLLGTSRTLAVGPVAMVSLLVASTINQIGVDSVTEYLLLAATLALMVGLIQLLMGFLKVGFLVNFLSHPVLSGFTSAAAILIGASQIKYMLGVSIPRTEYFYELFPHLAEQIGNTNLTVLVISLTSLGTLFYFKTHIARHLKQLGLKPLWVTFLSKIGPLVVVLLSTLLVAIFRLDKAADVDIVGKVPVGLPPLNTPSFEMDTWRILLPFALTISLLGYMESISMAKSLASKRRQKVSANQELVALGMANVGASLTGGYPVAGGFGRSMVNFMAGANTGLASIITAILMFITVVFLTPIFYYLPTAVLSAIIMLAVSGLLDTHTLKHTWQYNKIDALSLIITFLAVLGFGIETGILVGVATSLGLYLWRTSRPHVAIVGRIGDTEEYRNILRHEVATHPKILTLRIDESLYFPNAQYLEDVVLGQIADNPEIEHFVLVCNAVNYIDVSALEVLEKLHVELQENNITFNLAEVKGPVKDRLHAIGFVNTIGVEHCFISTHAAMQYLTDGAWR